MQRVMSNLGRRKNSMDALAKFRRAQELVQDIENLIEQEIATTPSVIPLFNEGNIARVKKSKRKARGIIKNYNSRKIRQVVNNMEYDPDAQKWIGNEEVLAIFSRGVPSIMNRSRHDKEKVVGNMIWDPVAGNWKGNEKDVRRFSSPRKPALITSLGTSAYLQKDLQGMTFDPVSMRWVGNDTEMDVFAQIDKLDDDGVIVGNEFHLSSPLAKSFIECANRHKSSLSGWFADGGMDRKAHLYAIRNMSILRVVRDIKHRRTTYVDMDDNSADIPERDVPSGAVESGNGNSADATEDYDEFDLAGKAMPTKLKLREVGADDWAKEIEFDDDDEAADADADATATAAAEPTKDVSSKAVASKAEKGEEDEDDWGSDFAEADADTLSNKLKSPPAASSLKRPAAMELTRHGSIVDLAALRKASGAQKARTVVEEDADGLELPAGPLRLVPAHKRQAHNDDEHLLNNAGEEPAESSNAENNAASPEPDFEEEEEEDWNDVDIPSTFPSLPSKHHDREQWDNDADLEITSEVLTLKKPKISDDEDEPMNSDEDMLDGLVIPENFVPQLKR